MANGNGVLHKLTPGNWIQIILIIGTALIAWGSLNSAVAVIVEREQEHYEMLRDELLTLEQKLDQHLFDRNIHNDE